MKQVSNTEREAASQASRAPLAATLAMVAGGLFVLASLVSIAVEWAWLALLVAFALLIYVVPQLHRFQSPADGWAGRVGSVLVAAGAAVMVALGLTFLIWEAFGDPGEPGWTNVVWPIAFFAFLIGIVLFTIGSAMAKKFPPAAPLLMLIGLVAAVAIDMATGVFFEDDPSATEWGFYIGIPLFGLGLAWMGYALRSASRTRPAAAD